MKTFLICWLGFLAASAPVVAQNPTPSPAADSPAASADAAPPPSAPPQRTAAELEKLAMPIALHPDPLISIILPAAAYPVEIVQAARFVKDTNNIPKLDQQPWDENVKAVARFPDLIAKMDADLNWTIALGQAFVEQPKELMDTIQSLRSKAQKAGTLQTTPQQVVTVTNVIILQTNVTQVVTVTNQVVQVQPANPQVVYVPTYSSTVYYPPPAYVYDPLAPLVSFGVGMAVGAIIANNCDWHGGCVWVGGGSYHGDVDIDIDHNININDNRQNTKSGSRSANTSAQTTQQKWQPDQSRMRSSGAPASAQSLDARGWSGGSATAANRATSPATGSARPSTQPAQRPASAQAAQRPGASTQPAARPSTGNTWSSPSAQPRSGSGATSTWQQPSGSRQAPSAASRPSPSPSVSRPSPSSSSAFNGVSNGGAARSASSRGGASRGGGRGR